MVVDGLADEDGNPVLLCGGLQARRHVHVRAQVGGVDFVLRADGTLNGPANVQAEAHPNLIVGT